jgi:arginyl-tRNA synthetase
LLRTKLAELFRAIISELIGEGRLPGEVLQVPVEISDPKNAEHGDFACNFALAASKVAGMNPRALGEALAEKLLSNYPSIIESVEVAGPGFINLRIHASFVAGYVETVLTPGFKLESTSRVPNPLKINVEFVSVNPNGPITIGSGRGAAYGSTLCKVLEAVGHTIHREYYINDGVNSEQMRQFAESVKAIVEGRPVPEKGYHGDYVHEVADKIATKDQSIDWYQEHSQKLMLEAQHSVLAQFGVEYDTWFSEQSLHDAGMVAAEIDSLEAKGIADYSLTRTKLKMAKGGKVEDVTFDEQKGDVAEDDDVEITEQNVDTLPRDTSLEREVGESSNPDSKSNTNEAETLWLRSAKLGDDMDRVLRRRDGRLTYIASDVAYHKDKFNRPAGADKLITVLGPDHHGYIGRLTAVVAAMLMEKPQPGAQIQDEIMSKLYRDSGEQQACEEALAKAKKMLEVQIFQLVRFVKDGKPAPMRKRDGNIYALIDLMREIGTKLKPEGTEADQLEAGKDVARFFYLMRSHDTTFDFDLDLAEKQSDENPVFYVQYAHARICSVLAKAQTTLSSLWEAGDGGDRTPGTSSSEWNPLLLTHDREKALIKKIVDLPDEVRRASEDYGVHRIATYAIELARTFHYFYDGCRVIQEDQLDLSKARMKLCEATKRTLKTTLDLLGVSAPEKM